MRIATFSLTLILLALTIACTTEAPAPTSTPAPTYTPYPTFTPVPTVTPRPTYTPYPTSTPAPTATAVPTPTETPAPTPTSTSTPTPIPTATTTPVPTNTPTPTATPRPTNTPVPTATRHPTSTPHPTAIPAINCPDCHKEYAPTIGHVDWLETPKVSASGSFSFKARVHEGHDIKIATPEPNGGRWNVHFSGGGELYGSVLPIDNTPGWKWSDNPQQWEADVYDYVDKTLTVVAQIDPAAATHPGLRMCLWSGGKTRDDTYILSCIEVVQP